MERKEGKRVVKNTSTFPEARLDLFTHYKSYNTGLYSYSIYRSSINTHYIKTVSKT